MAPLGDGTFRQSESPLGTEPRASLEMALAIRRFHRRRKAIAAVGSQSRNDESGRHVQSFEYLTCRGIGRRLERPDCIMVLTASAGAPSAACLACTKGGLASSVLMRRGLICIATHRLCGLSCSISTSLERIQAPDTRPGCGNVEKQEAIQHRGFAVVEYREETVRAVCDEICESHQP